MSAPTVGNIADLGKPIFDSGSSVPIYGGSPSSGVYVDEIWVEAVLDYQRAIYLYASGYEYLGPTFEVALAKINEVSNSVPSGASVSFKDTGSLKWFRGCNTYDNPYPNNDVWIVTSQQSVFVYAIPSGVNPMLITGVYVEYSVSTDVVSAYIANDVNLATKSLSIPLSSSSDFISAQINSEHEISYSGADKIAIVPFIPDDALDSSDYTSPRSGVWETGLLDVTPSKVYLKIKK